MATIKEKAHEIGWEYSKNYDPAACKQEWCEMAAREGANYVLECIENALNKAFDELSIRDGYLEARKCIEQLKN